MEWHAFLGISAGVLGIVSVVPYVKDILRGTTRPNLVSQSIWLLLEGIALGAQFAGGATWPLFVAAATTLNGALIVMISLFGYGYRAYGKLDGICFVLALTAIMIWWRTSDPVLALMLIVFTDFIATVPVIYKLFRAPDSEDPLAWSILAIAAALGVASTQKFDIANILYPIFILCQAGLIAALAFMGRRRVRQYSAHNI